MIHQIVTLMICLLPCASNQEHCLRRKLICIAESSIISIVPPLFRRIPTSVEATIQITN
jgi:hypothetical protein